MIAASLLSAVIVSFFGTIAFIGLLGPHIARRILGGDHRYLLVSSPIIGGIDSIGRGYGRTNNPFPHGSSGGYPDISIGRTFVYLSSYCGKEKMILHVQDLEFRYNSHPLIQDVSFEVKEGEILSILGPNGAGKTTLLKCLNRILAPRGGAIHIGR